MYVCGDAVCAHAGLDDRLGSVEAHCGNSTQVKLSPGTGSGKWMLPVWTSGLRQLLSAASHLTGLLVPTPAPSVNRQHTDNSINTDYSRWWRQKPPPHNAHVHKVGLALISPVGSEGHVSYGASLNPWQTLGQQTLRHLCFISVHILFANGCHRKRKLKHQTPAIIQNIIIFTWCRLHHGEWSLSVEVQLGCIKSLNEEISGYNIQKRVHSSEQLETKIAPGHLSWFYPTRFFSHWGQSVLAAHGEN